jgi:hypothetical protein
MAEDLCRRVFFSISVTPWSTGWHSEVTLGGSNITLIFLPLTFLVEGEGAFSMTYSNPFLLF